MAGSYTEMSSRSSIDGGRAAPSHTLLPSHDIDSEDDHGTSLTSVRLDEHKGGDETKFSSVTSPNSDPNNSNAGSGNDDIIVANNVHKTYLLGIEGVPALRGVSLSIRRGEWVTILGKSGGGKTSLLNIIGTIDKPTKGEITICSKRITANTTDEEFALLRLRHMYVFPLHSSDNGHH
jgi:ABC-type glutathione transport system ATPase component